MALHNWELTMLGHEYDIDMRLPRERGGLLTRLKLKLKETNKEYEDIWN